ncbi:MAG: MoaD/ThiS family protein [Pseudomonadota bacterium]
MSGGIALTVMFFASLREQLATESLALTLAPESRQASDRWDRSVFISAVAEALAGPRIDAQTVIELLAAPNVRLAVNQTLVADDDLVLTSGDTVAFLPPVTGG